MKTKTEVTDVLEKTYRRQLALDREPPEKVQLEAELRAKVRAIADDQLPKLKQIASSPLYKRAEAVYAWDEGALQRAGLPARFCEALFTAAGKVTQLRRFQQQITDSWQGAEAGLSVDSQVPLQAQSDQILWRARGVSTADKTVAQSLAAFERAKQEAEEYLAKLPADRRPATVGNAFSPRFGHGDDGSPASQVTDSPDAA